MKSLYPYQTECKDKAKAVLKKHGFVYLMMEVRTGKTAISLTTLLESGAKKVLFVTPKKAIPSIYKDREEFEGLSELELEVTTPQSLHKIEEKYGYDYFDSVVVDEAHKFGAIPRQSNVTVTLRAFTEDAERVIMMSGTPTPEGLPQIHPQFSLAGKRSPFHGQGNFYKWAKKNVDIEEVTMKKVEAGKTTFRKIKKYYKAKNDEDLSKTISEYSIDFTQQEAGFTVLPENVFHEVNLDNSIHVAVSRIQKRKMLKTSLGDIVADTPAVELQKIHQLSGGAIKITDPVDKSHIGDIHIDSSKIRECQKLSSDKKLTAIIYQYKAERDMLLKAFGSSVTEDVEEFQSGRYTYFIGQATACAFGVNLSIAHRMIIYSCNYSSATAQQIVARLQTKDRKEPFKVHWLFSDIGIEKDIYDTLQKKKRYTHIHYTKFSKKS